MATNAPKCPDPRRLRELIKEPQGQGWVEITDALDWLATFLENRNLYHKRQQLKNRIFKQLCVDRGLVEEANKLAKTAEFDAVANSAPDDDVYVDTDEDGHSVERKVG